MSGLSLARIKEPERWAEIQHQLRKFKPHEVKVRRQKTDQELIISNASHIAMTNRKIATPVITMTPFEAPSYQLTKEVKTSEVRLRKTKAGNRLQDIIKESMKQSPSEPIQVDCAQIQAELKKQLSKIPTCWQKIAHTFVKARLLNQKFMQMQLQDPNFDKKYGRLDTYFWNKYQLCSAYVGQEVKQKQNKRRTLLADSLHFNRLRKVEQVNQKKKIPKVRPAFESKLEEIGHDMSQVVKRNIRLADDIMRILKDGQMLSQESEDDKENLIKISTIKERQRNISQESAPLRKRIRKSQDILPPTHYCTQNALNTPKLSPKKQDNSQILRAARKILKQSLKQRQGRAATMQDSKLKRTVREVDRLWDNLRRLPSNNPSTFDRSVQ